jgi:hypothetical protein
MDEKMGMYDDFNDEMAANAAAQAIGIAGAMGAGGVQGGVVGAGGVQGGVVGAGAQVGAGDVQGGGTMSNPALCFAACVS